MNEQTSSARQPVSENWRTPPSPVSGNWRPRSFFRRHRWAILTGLICAAGIALAGLWRWMPRPAQPVAMEIACLYSAGDDRDWREFVQTLKQTVEWDRSLANKYEVDTRPDQPRECLVRGRDPNSGKRVLFRWYPATGTADK